MLVGGLFEVLNRLIGRGKRSLETIQSPNFDETTRRMPAKGAYLAPRCGDRRARYISVGRFVFTALRLVEMPGFYFSTLNTKGPKQWHRVRNRVEGDR